MDNLDLVLGGLLAAQPLVRVFGPALNEVGEALRRLTSYRVGNVKRVVEKSIQHMERSGIPEGHIAPRVSMRIIEEGSYSDDELIAEYLGGVLASAVSEDGSDDRGVAYSSLVTRLSSVELRFHYIYYATLRTALRGSVRDLPKILGSSLYFSHEALIPVLLPKTGWSDWLAHFTHALYGNSRESLIGEFGYGRPKDFSRLAPAAKVPGVALRPSRAGMELFMWGLGQGRRSIHDFTDEDLTLDLIDLDVPAVEGWLLHPPWPEPQPEPAPEPSSKPETG